MSNTVRSLKKRGGARAAIVGCALALLVAGMSWLAGPAWAQESGAADEAAAAAVPGIVVDAWARGDGQGVAEAFTDDVAFIAGDGRLVRGREALVPYFQEQFDGWLAGSRSVAKVESVTFLRDDVAVVHTIGGIKFPGELEVQPDWAGIQTWVVVQENGEWLAAAYQNSRISPEVQAATPAPARLPD